MVKLNEEGVDCKVVYGEELFEKKHRWSSGVVAFKNYGEKLPGTPELILTYPQIPLWVKNLTVGQLIKLQK